MVVGFGWVPPADWPSPPAQRSRAPRGRECRRGNGGFSQRVQQFGGMTPSPLSTPLPAIAGGGSFLFCNDPSAGSPTERLRFWLRTRLSSGPRLYLKRCAALLPANHPTPLNLWTTTIGAEGTLRFWLRIIHFTPGGAHAAAVLQSRVVSPRGSVAAAFRISPQFGTVADQMAD